MSESSGEKHFEATPSRIAKARREGNIARAGEFGANAAFVSAVVTLGVIAGPLAFAASQALSGATRGEAPLALSSVIVALGCAPLACAAIAGACASLVQNGGWQWVALSVKLERLSPQEGLKRMLSRETLAHAARATIAFVASSAAIAPTLRDLLSAATNGGGLPAIASAARAGAAHAMMAAAAIGLSFACVEYGMARRAWLRKLRMSFDDLKRELREHDGDPTTRSRRKALHRSLSQGAVASVAQASFVVANPTHVAVALEYDPPRVAVPRVLVSGIDAVALRVRVLATKYGIPIVENIALARALLRDARVGEAIPYAHYVAVAEVVSALLRAGVLE